MTIVRINVRTVFHVVAASALLLTAGESPAQQQAPPQRHALLIGVTRYPNLLPKHQLSGPANDVALMRQTLTGRFGVDRTRIVELAGWPADAMRRPTRANIQREFERLAKVASRGDHVMVLFAGHGSQQPDNDPPGEDEDDGMDEIFLPADAGDWDGGTGGVRNAIRDDDIRTWVTEIRNKGAFVWLVFDACQSSTLTRGVVTEKARLVSPEDLNIPKALLDKTRPTTRGGPPPESGVLGLQRDAGGIAALYAAQTIEPTPEKTLPDEKGRVHGLFTYTLNEILQQSTSALSYRDLAERTIDRYRALNRVGPTPGFEGGGLDNPVLNAGGDWGGPRLLIGEKNEKGIELRAGSIAGLTRGTILAVFPPAGAANSDKPIGHVRIVALDPTSATVESIPFAGMPPADPAKLVPNSRGEIAQFDYGDQVLKVAPSAAGVPPAVDAAITGLAKTTNGLAARAASLDAADWIVQVVGENVVLAPASGWQLDPSRTKVADDAQAPFLIGKSTSQDVAGDLGRVLNAISRARNLMRLAAAPAPGESEVDVEIELVRYKDKQDATGTVVSLEAAGRLLKVGDQVAFRLRNSGSATADVTLLFIDSKYGIEPLFPRRDREADSRLKPDATVLTSRFDVKGDTTGWEQVVAVAVEASPIRADFRFLAQPTLETTRSTRGTGGSPLQHLLERAMFGQGATRSLTASEVGRHAIKMLTWKTVKPATN